MRVCLNSRCVRKMNLGQSCRTDPCLATNSLGVCAQGLACVPSADPAVGTCQQSVLDTQGSLGCEPSLPSADQCPQGMTCEPRTGAGSCGTPVSNIQGGKPGLCVLPAAEGQGCDGNFTDSNPNLCARCERGTTCVMYPGESRGMCRRACTSLSNCPCGGSSACETLPSGGSYCRPCAGDGLECRRDGMNDRLSCCQAGAGSVCDATTNWRCCRPNAASCTENGQCCGSSRCISGSCAACRTVGQSATNAGQCCDGLILNGGVCKRQCNLGAVCPVPGATPGTACAVGRVAACDVNGNVTTCTQGVFPTTETCNGVDDNCNGQIDEGLARTTCSNPTRLIGRGGSPETMCMNGGAPQQGVLLCERGVQTCTAFEDFHFCRRCGTRTMLDPTSTTGASVTTNCGSCLDESCQDGSPNTCMPGLSCLCPMGPGSCSAPNGYCAYNPTCTNAPNRCWPRVASGNYGPTCL